MIAFLVELSKQNGGIATWKQLQEFRFQGRQIPLIGQKWIRKIRGHESAFTILTTYRHNPKTRPYDDAIGADGYPRYKWRGQEGAHPDNESLRQAMLTRKSVAWFEGVQTGVYLIHEAVWIAGEEQAHQHFVLALDETMRDQWQPKVRMSFGRSGAAPRVCRCGCQAQTSSTNVQTARADRISNAVRRLPAPRPRATGGRSHQGRRRGWRSHRPQRDRDVLDPPSRFRCVGSRNYSRTIRTLQGRRIVTVIDQFDVVTAPWPPRSA